MSHPASLLKKYLMELNERVNKLDAKLDSNLQILNEEVQRLGVKIDGCIQDTNGNAATFDSKLNGNIQTVRGEIRKLDSNLARALVGSIKLTDGKIKELHTTIEGGLHTANEEIHRLDAKLCSSIQMTDQSIGALFREKLSVQEFREFVEVFDKTLGDESHLLHMGAISQTSEPGLKDSNDEGEDGLQREPFVVTDSDTAVEQGVEDASAAQVFEVASTQIVEGSFVDETSEVSQDQILEEHVLEEDKLPLDITTEEPVSKHVGFPMQGVGESFYVGDGVTSVVGDVEIPPGTTVDETLVVKGTFKSSESCRLVRAVKALKNIEIGVDNKVEGNLISGGKVTIGPNCVVKGSIESDGDVEIGDNVIVEERLISKSLVTVSDGTQFLQGINAAKGFSVTKAAQHV